MVRTAQAVSRINERFTGPFLGLSEHNEPEMIGPTRCEDCDNVLMIDGRIQQRFGLTISGVVLPNLKPHALLFFSQRVSSPTADPVTYSTLGVVQLENTSSGAWTLYRKPVGSDWEVVTGGVDGTAAGLLALIGLLGRGGTFATMDNVPAYNSIVYLLDGATRMYKTPINADYQKTIGIQVPTDVEYKTVGDVCTNWSSTWFYAVSLCDRLQAPVGSTLQHPGQESSSVEEVTNGALLPNARNFWFQAPYSDGALEDQWTHARVYVKEASGTTFKLLANFPRHADFSETGDGNVLNDHGTGAYSAFWDYGTGGDGIEVQTADAFDFRPTRNGVPNNMNYLAIFKGRAFWARNHEPLVYYSDVIGPLTGGHPEALPGEYLEGFDGPVSMLAEYNDALIIGTPTSLYRLTGAITSHTNASQETGATIGVIPAKLVPVPVASGPMAGGLGNHVKVDGLLYFITNRGLEAFNGVQTLDLSRAIREHPGFAASDFTKASLAVDYKNGFLYVAAPPDIWVYHFRNLDPDTGVGTWTFWDKADRSYDFQVATASDALSPNVALGSYDTSGTEGRMDSLPSVLETSSESRPWSWLSGDIDLGIPDRRKRWYTLTVHGRDDVTTGARVSYSVDDRPFVVATVDFNTNTTIKIHINEYGRRMRVRFDGLTGTLGNTRIMGYDIEAELLDYF